MLTIKNYKAFHGIMRITPRGMIVPAFELEADWLYNPDSDCWCNNEKEFAEDICTVVSDDTERLIPKKPLYEDRYAQCPKCANDDFGFMHYWGCHFCPDCGQKLDWNDNE